MSAGFVQHRILAASRAHKFAKDRRGTTEVHIADIYKYFPFRLFGLTRDDLPELARLEFEAELELCRVNPEMLQQYTDMKRGGFHVGFISDTYWSTEQLAQLLRKCSPGLTWDFLYASCDHGSSKSEALFAAYLTEQGVDCASSFHIGDNEHADIKGARRHGIRPRHYPQASAALTSKLQREASIFELLWPEQPSRLDHGARTLRRVVTAQSAEQSAAFHLGLTVVGPVMAAFGEFIEARRTALTRDGARVAVAFLGRDGFLPHRIWQAARGDIGAYVEVNRRVSLVGSATTLEPLCDLLGRVVKIDAPTFVDLVKVQPSAVMDFFAQHPDGIVSGRELADALPDLMDPHEITDVAAGVRARLLGYLRAHIPDLDSCTDLILVDVGYSANVQKSLRRIFDREGMRIRLHGAYLMTLDDAFDDIDDDDTAEGLISDRVVTPYANRMLIRNATLLEQLCCPPQGSVRDYRGSEVLRERDQRPAAQLALATEVQSGALTYAARARELAPRYALQPHADLSVAARWAATVLGRFLLLPDDDELVLLGGIKHDLNLGTQALVPMVDANYINDCIIARGLGVACTVPAPPMWLGGSFAALSPSHAYLYTLFGANRLPANVFGEAQCGTLEVGLFGRDGGAALENINVTHTGLGDLRLRVPLSRGMAVATIALPLAKLAREGLLHGITIQYGASAAKAAESAAVKTMAEERLTFAGLARSGRHFRASSDDGMLLIPVDGFDDEVAIYTIALTSFSHDRILAVEDCDAEAAPSATLSWRGINRPSN